MNKATKNKNATPTKNTKVVDLAWGSVELEMKPKKFTPTLPPLPYKQWMEICSFLKFCQTDRQGEGIVSLTLIKKKWHIICWNQEISGSLHVKYEEGSEENQALLTDELREALDNIHCTVHSHYTSGAFQSGDDKDDELQKIGWHVTVGKMNLAKMDSHARWNLNKPARRNREGVKIENAIQSWIEFKAENIVGKFKAPKAYAAHPSMAISHEETVHITPNNSFFPEEWKLRALKKKYQTNASNFRYGQGLPCGNKNPMLPVSIRNHKLCRDTGSDYTLKSFKDLNVNDANEITKLAMADTLNLKTILKERLHTEAKSLSKAVLFMPKEKRKLMLNILAKVPASIPETDALCIANSTAWAISTYIKDNEYSWSKFDNAIEAMYKVTEDQYEKLYTKHFSTDPMEDIQEMREQLEGTLGVQQVEKMSVAEVVASFSL